MGSTSSYTSGPTRSVNLDDVMPRAIAKAIIHTKQVACRPHQKSTRIERVQHFITDLHREIHLLDLPTSINASIQNDLCSKAVWFDVGELESKYTLPNISWKQLVVWVDAARTMTLGLEEQCSVMEGDIELLKADLGSMRGVTSRMERINEKAEEVLEQVVSLMEE